MRSEIRPEKQNLLQEYLAWGTREGSCWDLYGGLLLLLDESDERTPDGNITEFRRTPAESRQKEDE